MCSKAPKKPLQSSSEAKSNKQNLRAKFYRGGNYVSIQTSHWLTVAAWMETQSNWGSQLDVTTRGGNTNKAVDTKHSSLRHEFTQNPLCGRPGNGGGRGQEDGWTDDPRGAAVTNERQPQNHPTPTTSKKNKKRQEDCI